VNPALDSVFARALAHEPHERFRTVGEFASTFEAAIGAREPEMASTMAFPAVMDEPPPPGPGPAAGGYGPPPGASPAGDAGYPPAPAPYTGAAAYTATMPSSTAMVQPNSMPASPPQRSASGRLAPIMVGVVAVLLIGGGVAAWMAMGSGPPQDGPIAVNTQQSAAPATTGAPTATPTAAPPPEPTPAPTAEAPAQVEAKIKCTPACDEIMIDDQKVEDMTKPIMLAPGSHKVAVSKSGYVAQTDTITVEAGKPFSKDFKLVSEKPAVAAAPPPTTPRPPTGGGSSGGGTAPPLRKCGKLIKTNCK
jgi:hypothetical protein